MFHVKHIKTREIKGSDLKIELLTPSGIFAILMSWHGNLGLNMKAPFIM